PLVRERPIVVDPVTRRSAKPLGPVELIVLKYYGDHFTGVPASMIQTLADAGAIRIIDALFARKGEDGQVRVFEISGLLNHDDILSLTDGWAPKTSGAVLLFENVWAGKFREAVTEAGGEI